MGMEPGRAGEEVMREFVAKHEAPADQHPRYIPPPQSTTAPSSPSSSTDTTIPPPHAVYVSQGDDMGPLRTLALVPRIADFNLCHRGPVPDDGTLHFLPIRNHKYRSPEVILGVGNGYSTDGTLA